MYCFRVSCYPAEKKWPLHDARAPSLLLCVLRPCDLLSVYRDSEREIFVIFRLRSSKRSQWFWVVHTDKSFIVNIIIIHTL